MEIIPSILVESAAEFERRLRLVENECLTVHVDVLDGTLFPHMSWADPAHVGALRTEVDYELHLMVENPLPIVEAWKKLVPGMKRAIVHAEIKRPLGAVLEAIRACNLEAAVAMNPETPVHAVHPFAHHIRGITVMGVHPGASGQGFLGEPILEKLRLIAEHFPDLPVEIDGGVTSELLPVLLGSGATRLCAASAVFGSPDPAAALRKLREAASTFDR